MSILKKIISKQLVNIILTFLITWSLLRVTGTNPGNILSVVIFLLVYLFNGELSKKEENLENKVLKRYKLWADIVGALFTLFYMIYARDYIVPDLDSRLFKMAILTISTVGLFILLKKVITFLFIALNGQNVQSFEDDTVSAFGRFVNKHAFWLCFAVCFVCYLPYFLYLFPGVMTPDSINQFEQVLGVVPLSNHHPVMHTLFMGMFYYLGFNVFHDGSLAAGLYTLVQLLFVCFGAAFTVDTLKRVQVKWQILLAVTAFYAVIPYNAIMASTVWKDIPFAVIVTTFICLIVRLDRMPITIARLAGFGVTGFFMCLFRSNGWYGFILLVPFILWHFRKNILKIGVTVGLILVFSIILKYPIMNSLNIIQPDFIESLSVPAQQMAYVICVEEDINYQDMQEVKKVIDLTYIRELYRSNYADNIKELVRAGDQDYLKAHKLDFLKMYIRWGLKYPGDYIRAYVGQTYGYYYPDREYDVADAEGVIDSSLDIHSRPFIVGKIPLKMKEIAIKLGNMVPMYSLIWCIGAVFWSVLFFMGLCGARGEYKKMIWFMPCLLMVFTVLIATPLAYSMRYVYFMFFSLPLYPILTLLKDDRWND